MSIIYDEVTSPTVSWRVQLLLNKLHVAISLLDVQLDGPFNFVQTP